MISWKDACESQQKLKPDTSKNQAEAVLLISDFVKESC
jgi:hypothetical protein